MYGYLIAAGGCAAAAWRFRKLGARKRLYEAALLLAAGFFLAAVFEQMDEGGYLKQISRNGPGRGQEEKHILVDAEGILEQYPMKVQVEEKKLTRKQKQEYLDRAKEELDQEILGDNPSLEAVSQSLYLPEVLQEGAVEAEYRFSDYEVFDIEGNLIAPLEEPVLVEVTAELTCQEEVCLYQFFVQAVPGEKTAQESFAEKLEQLLASENNRENADYLVLPEQLDDRKLTWKEQKENRSGIMALLGIAGGAAVVFSEKEEKKKKELQRRRQMLLDYSEIVSQLSLLLGAGMNLTLAWEKIAAAYQSRRKRKEVERREAYEEMVTVLHEIQAGVGELQAFENFGTRCDLSVYRKLASLIVRNIRKGSKGLQRLLEEEEREAFEQRKAEARKAGEEAGTKLLLPMGIMLVLVLVILVVPAGLTLNI
ncbi:MAG: hypothetical protein HFH50_09125 [Lachnospiraceae bacterium]|jgi:tight adherence protein C|nr:hypothetical protein [Lachnospiraceae bacterium]